MKVTILMCVLACSLAAQQQIRSHITVVDRDGKNPRVVHVALGRFEAPNWSPDGKWLVLNSQGKLWRLAVTGGEPELIPTGKVTRINNDHGISPDGKQLVISAGQMYVLPFAGGEPKQVTQLSPSYFHGWSPDGRTLAYCAPRDKNFDIYAIPVEGGQEQRLTVHPGYDDGPEYSPDGKWIYFNSDRSGGWDLWRIPASGAGPDDHLAERITSDERDEWFPHFSPDGKWIVYLSFDKGTEGHPADKNVLLHLMPAKGGKSREIVKLFGGQGTINVNSWSPDSKRFAYVSYTVE
ncbi:MAG TPA: hypothetical protein VN428_24035 [Bryobacteraceae bacterium]|nr:hypothetical protein [Bryobacteraceae bacterium]